MKLILFLSFFCYFISNFLTYTFFNPEWLLLMVKGRHFVQFSFFSLKNNVTIILLSFIESISLIWTEVVEVEIYFLVFFYAFFSCNFFRQDSLDNFGKYYWLIMIKFFDWIDQIHSFSLLPTLI
jgi:hypothetical protein